MFAVDVLLQANGIFHHGEAMTEDKELMPALQNFIVLTWLRQVHHDLPKLVKQQYDTELSVSKAWDITGPLFTSR